MLSHALERYCRPLRLPVWPAAISLPYTRRLLFLQHRHIGSPALDCLSSAACRPCYPGRPRGLLPFSRPACIGLPHVSTGSASSKSLTRLRAGSLALRPATLPFGNSRPLITQTPLPRATGMNGQLPGRDSNPLDEQLLLRTDTYLFPHDEILNEIEHRISDKKYKEDGKWSSPSLTQENKQLLKPYRL